MFRIRFVLLSLVVALTAGMVASASASATTRWLVCEKVGAGKGTYKGNKCKEEGGGKEWEIEPVRANTYWPLNGEGEESKLETSGLTIKCGGNTLIGLIGPLGEIEYKTTFASCKVVSHSECTVSSDVFEVKGALGGTTITEDGSLTALELTLQPGSEITISGCSLKKTIKLEGKMTCQMPNMGEMNYVHEIICKPSGSEIEIEIEGETEKEIVKEVKFTGTEQVWLDEYKTVWFRAEI